MGSYRGVFKCEYCRKIRKKCVRLGPWEENGEQQKCENCKSANRPCGASTQTKREEKGNISDSKDSGIGEEIAMADTSDAKEVKQRLDQALKDMDAQNGAREELYRTLGPHLERQRQIQCDDIIYKTMPDFKELIADQMSSTTASLSSLAVAEEYADKAASLGEKADAERAYLRIREVYGSLPVNVAIPYQKLLKKMAAFYSENKDPRRAEKYLLECAQLHNKAGIVDEEVWSDLARVLPESSRKLDRELEMVRNNASTVQVGQPAFPPLHRVIRSGCIPPRVFVMDPIPDITGSPPRVFVMDPIPDITGSPPLHYAITKNIPAAYAMVQNGTEEQLELPDKFSRTPMFLAAMFVAEKIGFALMTRYMVHPVQRRQRLVNARDNVGHTILAMAILSGCTFGFIEALVMEFHANVDPDPMRRILSPLQAAAVRGRSDVASLLLFHGAQDKNTYLDELSASALARNEGYEDIETLIVTQTSF